MKPRTPPFTLQLSTPQRAKLDRLAAAAGISSAEVLRRLLDLAEVDDVRWVPASRHPLGRGERPVEVG